MPAALVAVAGGIAAVAIFDLRALGVAVTGAAAGGLPEPHVSWFDAAPYRSLLQDAAGIVLISFASGVLTAKSFARRNHYEIDANQELIAFGASNLASAWLRGSRSPARTREPRSTTRWAARASWSASSRPAPCSWSCSCSQGRWRWSRPRRWRR